MRLFTHIAIVLALAAAARPARAQDLPSRGLAQAGEPTSSKPGVLGRVGIDQRIGERIPLDLPFTDETGKTVRLGDYFGKRPVILALVYYECPMLCTQVLNGLVSALGVMNFEPGREFEVVAVSFNPKEGPGLAAQKKAAYMERYKRPHTANGWHFLTGTEASIRELTEAVGFRYELDEEIQQYAHGAAIEVLTPKGTLARYFYGIEYSARDIRFGVIEAAEERIGSAVDQVLLLCYHYDPATGKYGATVLGLVRLGGVATVVAFVAFLIVSLRRERTRESACGPRELPACQPKRRPASAKATAGNLRETTARRLEGSRPEGPASERARAGVGPREQEEADPHAPGAPATPAGRT